MKYSPTTVSTIEKACKPILWIQNQGVSNSIRVWRESILAISNHHRQTGNAQPTCICPKSMWTRTFSNAKATPQKQRFDDNGLQRMAMGSKLAIYLTWLPSNSFVCSSLIQALRSSPHCLGDLTKRKAFGLLFPTSGITAVGPRSFSKCQTCIALSQRDALGILLWFFRCGTKISEAISASWGVELDRTVSTMR